MSMLFVYIFVMMDKFIAGLIILTAISAAGFIISAMCMDTKDVDVRQSARRKRNTFAVTFLIIGFLAVATPSTRQFAAIYMIPKVVNNEDVKAMSNDAMKIMRLKFEAYIDSIDPAKEIKEAVAPKE